MVSGRFNPPPVPSTPERAPWEEVKELTKRLDRLAALMEGGVGIPGAPTNLEQLILILKLLAPESIGKSAVIPFQKTVATAYQDEQDRQVPFHGVVQDVIMAFPAGCQQLVEVRLVYYPQGGSKSFIVPTIEDSFIALDDFTMLFQPRFLVEFPGNLRVEWWNYDSLNTHCVPVVALVVPTELEVKE